MNRLIHGDCLEVLKNIPPESVDLIYLDPPFFSDRNYEIIWGDDQESRSFGDRFAGGIEHYIDWLKERVELMKLVLKKTGSIYLHCDYHANAYIKVKILDPIFGANNFRNEIIWCYSTSGRPKTFFPKKHDNIYLYTKSSKFYWNKNFRVNYSANYIKTHFTQVDKLGNPCRIRIDSGKERIYYPNEGMVPNDWWEIPYVNSQAKERIGYPTQKPEALLERIIKASSNENNVVLDPFCGGGTTLAVANKLNRQWIGIDQSIVAIKVAEARLANNNQILKKTYAVNQIQAHKTKTNNENIDLFTNANNLVFSVELHKYDYDTLRNSDAFKFEDFIIRQFGGTPNDKQRSDKGIDGKAKDGTPVQVKRQDSIGRNVVDNFISAIKRNDKKLFEKKIKNKEVCGTIIAFSFGKGIIEEVARLKNNENIIIELKNVEDIVSIAKRPKIKLKRSDAFKFEDFIIRQFGGEPNQKQRSDNGIDGKAKDGTPIQVKCQSKIERNVVDNFISAIKSKDKNLFEKKVKNKEICGTIIAFSFSKEIIGEVARLKNDENIIIELKKVTDIVSIAKPPKIKLKHSETTKSNEKFVITFNVEIQEIQTQKVSVVLWDFNYDKNKGFCADVNFSKDDHLKTEITKEFVKGTYEIAVKVTDEDGLEAIDTITIHL